MNLSLIRDAAILRDTGRYTEALLAFESLESKSDLIEEKAVILWCEVECACWINDPSRARAILERLRTLTAGITEFEIRADVAEALIETLEGSENAALTRLDEILDQHSVLLRADAMRDVYEDIQLRRGSLLTRKGQFEKAQPLLEEGLTFVLFKGPEYYHDLALCHLADKKYDSSRQFFEKALAMEPEARWAFSAHRNLGKVLLWQGAYAKALMQFEDAEQLAIKLNWPREPLYELMALSFDRLQMPKDAERYREKSRRKPNIGD
jgi:tetratricopeptide (TPR) repeat protein